MTNATSQEAAAEDEQDVGEDRAEHTRLDDANFAILKGYDTDL